jgi:hypothetical protein
MTVHATFGILNALTISDLVAWSDAQVWFGGRLPWLNTVTSPHYQDTRNLPLSIKAAVEQRLWHSCRGRQADHSYHSFTAAVNHMNQAGQDCVWQQFWSDVDQLDAYKHSNIRHGLPELASHRP